MNRILCLLLVLCAPLCMTELNALSIDLKNSKMHMLEVLSNVYDKIQNNYIEDVQHDQLIDGALHGMLGSIDNYSEYFNIDELSDFEANTRGSFVGIGIEIYLDNKDERCIVSNVTEESPAFEAGMKSNDVIISVDGENVSGMKLSNIVRKIRGEANETVIIIVLRESELVELNIKRKLIEVEPAEGHLIEGIIYLKIKQFGEDVAILVEKLMGSLRESLNNNCTGIVLDLRNNPGGLLDQAVAVSDLFIDKDRDIVSTMGKTRANRRIHRSKRPDISDNIPLVILINNDSASASEIVAGAMQDNKRALIIGEKSFGKGSVQTILKLKDKNVGAIKLTTALYYTPSGKSINNKGIEPDIVVQTVNDNNSIFYFWLNKEKKHDDIQLNYAIDLLNNRDKYLSLLK